MKQKGILRMEKLKHIIIAVYQEVGKSTICHGLSEKIHYKHIPLDPIIWGFQKNFPEIGITHADTIINVSKKLAPFINTWLS